MKYLLYFDLLGCYKSQKKIEPHLQKQEAETNRPSKMSTKSQDEKFFSFFFLLAIVATAITVAAIFISLYIITSLEAATRSLL